MKLSTTRTELVYKSLGLPYVQWALDEDGSQGIWQSEPNIREYPKSFLDWLPNPFPFLEVFSVDDLLDNPEVKMGYLKKIEEFVTSGDWKSFIVSTPTIECGVFGYSYTYEKNGRTIDETVKIRPIIKDGILYPLERRLLNATNEESLLSSWQLGKGDIPVIWGYRNEVGL